MKNKNLSGDLSAARSAPPALSEAPLSAQIARWLDARNIYNDRLQCAKVQTISGRSIHLCKTETPHIFAIISGQIIFIEVKMRGQAPKPEQLEKHLELMNAGAIVLVADSFDQFVCEFNAYREAIELREKEMMRLIK